MCIAIGFVQSVSDVWRLAMEDPHLMRLRNFLEHLEGPKEVARLHHDDIGFEDLEKASPSS